MSLFPAFQLLTFKMMLFVMLLELVRSNQQWRLGTLNELLLWRYIAFVQFFIVFLFIAAFYPVWDSPRYNNRFIFIESGSISLLCLFVLAVWLKQQKAEEVKRALIQFIPIGLTVCFAISSAIYFSGIQVNSVPLFTDNTLMLPFWFLVLTMSSFSWFFEMKGRTQVWRVLLFLMAGMMALYGAARLVLIAWTLCGVFLTVWLTSQTARRQRLQALAGTVILFLLFANLIIFVDYLAGGKFAARLSLLSQIDLYADSNSSHGIRLSLWQASLSIISENAFSGVGQVNERIALNQELSKEFWFRAHQSYLSFLIAGGVFALLSGLIMQSSALIFLSRARRSGLFPAFLGFGIVVTLNCFTDSIFQSSVAVQAYMVGVLIFLRASDSDVPRSIDWE